MNSPSYYQEVRSEIIPLLPDNPCSLLDIGCGHGATARVLKSLHPGLSITGIDICDPNPDFYPGFYKLVKWNLEEGLPELSYQHYDTILLLDVLEHLSNPQLILSKLSNELDPSACVIISLPNFHYYGNLAEIIVSRRFRYKDSGILDRTHLRFFGKQDAIDLIAPFFVIDRCYNHHLRPQSLLNKILTLMLGHSFTSYQFIFRVFPKTK